MEYGLQLVGKIRVFTKTREIKGSNLSKYTVFNTWFNVSKKDANGEYENVSMNLIFPKNEPKPDNNTIINIVEAFPMISGQGQYKRIVFYVKEWFPC